VTPALQGQGNATSLSRSARLLADLRTLASAMSYLLEPETTEPMALPALADATIKTNLVMERRG
jgi:hypothetical protein